MNLELQGARVIVTAGAGGIGRAIVDAFQAEGAHVATCDIDGDGLRRCRRALPAKRSMCPTMPR